MMACIQEIMEYYAKILLRFAKTSNIVKQLKKSTIATILGWEEYQIKITHVDS